MAEQVIHVEQEALEQLTKALAEAGEDYKKNLKRLTTLIAEITSGDIKGDPADELLVKFQAKEDIFNKMAETIDEAEGYLGMQTTSFTNMIGDLVSGMK